LKGRNRYGQAILLIAALLATVLGLDRLIQADHEDGSLDLLINRSSSRGRGAHQMCSALGHERLPLFVLCPLFGLLLAWRMFHFINRLARKQEVLLKTDNHVNLFA
jgi:heme exporter protein CcmB